MGIYAIMLPSSGFSVAHWFVLEQADIELAVERPTFGLVLFPGPLEDWAVSEYTPPLNASFLLLDAKR